MRITQFAIPAVMYAAWSSNHGNLMWDSGGYEHAIFFQAHTNITNSTYHQPYLLNPEVFLTSPFAHDPLHTKWNFTRYGHGKGVRINNTSNNRRSYGRGRKFMPQAIASECSKMALIFALIDWMLTFLGFPSLRETLNIETDDRSEEETGLADVMSGGEGPEMGAQVEKVLRLAELRDDDVNGDGWVVRRWGRGYGWVVDCERD